MDLLGLGRSGVLAFQRALNATGENVANADTPGFVRRRAVLATQPAGRGGPMERSPTAAGVRFDTLARDVDALKANAARVASGDKARFAARLDWLERLEGLGASADVEARVGALFNAANDLAAAPTNRAARTLFLDKADDAATAFAGHGEALAALSDDISSEAALSARTVNDLAAALVRINEQLRRGDAGDAAAAGMLDNRDRLLADLAAEVRISINEGPRGVVEVKLGSGPSAVQLVPQAGNRRRIGVAPDGATVLLNPEFDPTPLRLPASGRLAGLLEACADIRRARAALDSSATGFAALANDWHARGVDAGGKPGRAMFATLGVATTVGKANAGRAPVDVVLADGAVPDASGYRLIADAAGFTLARGDGSASITGAGPLLLDGLTVSIGDGAVAGDQWTLARLDGARALALRPLPPDDVAAAARWQIDAPPNNTTTSLPTIIDDAAALALPGGSTTPPPWRISVIAGGLAEIHAGAALIDTVPADGSLIAGPGVRFTLPADAAQGDLFRISPTPAGSPDNGNALDLGRLRLQRGPNGTLEAELAADSAGIGARVADTRRLEAAAATLKEDTARANDAVSGVDLEYEAAELTRLQAAYRANAQVIGVARDLFDQILGLSR